VRAQNEMISGRFDIPDRRSIVFQNSVHIELAFAIRRKCVVMTVNQERRSGHQAGIHARGVVGIGLDEHEALPGGTITLGIGFELAQEALFELEDVFDVDAGDQRVGSGDGGIGEQNVFEFVAAGRNDGGALVDFGGIEQVEHGKMLHGQDFVHAFEAQSALLIEEVRDVGLLESGLLGEPEARQFARLNPFPQDIAKIILQDFELHRPEYSTGQSRIAPSEQAPEKAREDENDPRSDPVAKKLLRAGGFDLFAEGTAGT